MKYLIFILILLLPVSSIAKITSSVQDGLWSDSTTWDNGIPVTGDYIYIYHAITKNSSYDIGTGSIIIQKQLDISGDLSAGVNGYLGVFGSGALNIYQGDLTCDGCRVVNRNDFYVEGSVLIQFGSLLINSCQFFSTGDIEFRANSILEMYMGSVIKSDRDIDIEDNLKNYGGIIEADNIVVGMPPGAITGYGGIIRASYSIINSGLIEGDINDHHYLVDSNCIISGPGTMAYVHVCTTQHSITQCVPNTALPVKLISIEATARIDGSITLSWRIKAERDFSHYEIERFNNNDWIKIGEVSSIYNNSTTGGDYEYIDDPKVTEVVYYRLKMIDLDNSYEYSPVVSAQARLLSGTVSIYPNPVSGKLLNLRTKTENLNSIRVIDLSGRILKKLSPISHEQNEIQLEISDLQSGIYLLEIQKVNETITRKFVKY